MNKESAAINSLDVKAISPGPATDRMSVNARINAHLVTWTRSALAPWQHEAFRRILSKGTLTAQDKKDIFQRAKYDLRIEQPPSPLPEVWLTGRDLPISSSATERVYLLSLRDLEGVNALKGGQRLDFGKNLTLIYGENGSGKSGYARVLKKGARCTEKAVEQILPNVFHSPSATAPAKATFDLDRGSGSYEVLWEDGKQSHADLQHFAVFDARCARQYVSSANQLSFAPAIFDFLRILGEVIAEIKIAFADLAKALAPATPPPFHALLDDTSVGKALAQLSASTDLGKLRICARWEDSDGKNLTTKENDLNKLKAQSSESIKQHINREKRDATTIYTKVKEALEAFDDSSVASLQKNVANVANLEQAFEAAKRLALGQSRIEGVGSDAWKTLLEAASVFSKTEAYKDQPFPPSIPGTLCVLCQQPLDDDATERLKGFWNFLEDKAAKDRDAARLVLKNALKSLADAPTRLPPELTALADEFESNHAELWKHTVQLFSALGSRSAAIKQAATDGTWENVPAISSRARELSQQLISSLEEKLAAVPGDDEAQATIAKLASEIDELKARKGLSENLTFVIDHVNALQASAKAKTAADGILTNSISLKAKALHAEFMTDAFRMRVKDKLTDIGLPPRRLSIGERAERGKVLHSVSVEGAVGAHPPENVFSEGERTAISLAFFLADLGSVEDTSALIFDDPVTSLDHRFREGVVKTLVEEAKCRGEEKGRQVVIFTHDLAFFCEVASKARFELVDSVACVVEAFNDKAGVVSQEIPWDAMPVKERTSKLQTLVAEAKALESADEKDQYKEKVPRFYGRLRATWERVVEELLFNRVVSRYERAVQTMQLRGVAIEKDAVTTIFEAMTRCSKIIDAHDHSSAATVSTPTGAEMQADLTKLTTFVGIQKKRNQTAEDANAHLKG